MASDYLTGTGCQNRNSTTYNNILCFPSRQ